MAMGSGDSFVLRNHGMKAMLPEHFPERAFSTRYAIKTCPMRWKWRMPPAWTSPPLGLPCSG
jgi:hypothetical protein